jgi:hypothetical protein
MRIAVIGVLVASMVFAGARRLTETARLAATLTRVEGLEARRALLFGPWYAAMEQVRRAVPPAAAVDFVMLRPEARDVAVLAAAELQPRDVRLFDGWAAWRQRTRAILIHDARAANAAPGPSPPPAAFVVVIDPNAAPPLRIVHAP